MVEIRYREYGEEAELVGKSVAYVREQYQPAFGIPSKATAYLNGKKVKKELEPELELCDHDELAFKEASKMPMLMAALLAALAVTGGMFAYTQTSSSVTVGVTRSTDFVTVTANNTVSGWTVFGNYKGTIPSGSLFNIEPAAGYPGDLVTTLYLGNGDELVNVYRVLVMRVSVYDSLSAKVVGPELLTLAKGEVDLPMDIGAYTGPFAVEIDGGFYISHMFHGWTIPADSEDPLIYCDVTQR